jgi:hypothetical protein
VQFTIRTPRASTLAAVEAVFDERQQHAVLVVAAVEECANVSLGLEDRAAEPNRALGLTRSAAVLAARRTHLPAPESGVHSSDAKVAAQRPGRCFWPERRDRGLGRSPKRLRSG